MFIKKILKKWTKRYLHLVDSPDVHFQRCSCSRHYSKWPSLKIIKNSRFFYKYLGKRWRDFRKRNPFFGFHNLLVNEKCGFRNPNPVSQTFRVTAAIIHSLRCRFEQFWEEKGNKSLYDRVLAVGHPSSLTDLARQGIIWWPYSVPRFTRFWTASILDSYIYIFVFWVERIS